MLPRNGVTRVVLSAFFAIALAFQAWAQSPSISDQTLKVGEQTFRYLSAGTDGPPIVLLHGWPQSADKFRAIMPELAKNYIVYAPDLSGIGGSNAPKQRWDKASLANDIKGFVDQLGLESPLIVGHDIGGMVAYAYGRLYLNEATGIVILDVPIPGLAPWDDVATSRHAWHFDFHAQDGLVETLVAGRQAEYFRYFIDKVSGNSDAISDDDVETYAEAYSSADSLRAGFEFYRAFDTDAAFFAEQKSKLQVPILILGAEFSTASALPVMEASLAEVGVTHIQTKVIPNAGHWVSEEEPAATATAITDFADAVFAR